MKIKKPNFPTLEDSHHVSALENSFRPVKNTSPYPLSLSFTLSASYSGGAALGGVCEGLLRSVHSSSYSGGKQKSDRQIYYSVIDTADAVHNKAGHLYK